KPSMTTTTARQDLVQGCRNLPYSEHGFGYQYYSPAIRVGEGQCAVLGPVRIFHWDGLMTRLSQPFDRLVHVRFAGEIEHQQVVRGRRRTGAAIDVRSELEMV